MNQPRFRIVLAALLLSVSGGAGAESVTIKQMLFLPPVYYVGDQVEVRIRVSATDSELPLRPSHLPQSEWFRVVDVRVIPIADEYDIRIRFTSFQTGVRELPVFQIGELTLGPIPIETASIRDAEELSVFGTLEPIVLPGTRLFIALAAGIVFLGPLSIIIVLGWLRKTAGSIVGSIGNRKPYRRLVRSLDALQNGVSVIDARSFYVSLLEAFRGYLTNRSLHNYNAATTHEMDLLLGEEYDGIEALEGLSQMVGSIDGAKFGGARIGVAELSRGLSLVRSATESIETRFRARRS